MASYPAKEDYLKAIYLLHQAKDRVRECDVATFLGYTKASVCFMVKKQLAQGYVSVDAGNLRLTESGLQEALQIFLAYQTSRRFLIEVLGVAETTARQDACRMEHILSDETLAAMRRML